MTVATVETSTLGRWVEVLVPASQLAERICDTEFVPRAMRGKPDVVTAAIMYGDELGIGPMQALAGIHVVEGKPQPSAELMRAMILRAGHSLAVHEMTGTRCRVSGLRRDRPEAERAYVEWTMDQARAAGLAGKTNWRSYPRALLLARATADLARLLFPDVIKGLSYIVEDESAQATESWPTEPAAEDEPEAPALPQRKRKPRGPHGPRAKDVPRNLPPATDEHPAPDGSVDVPLPELPGPPPQAQAGATRPPVAPSLPDTPSPDLGVTGEPEGVPVPITDRRLGGVMASWDRIARVDGTTMTDPTNRDLRLRVTSALLERPIRTTRQVSNSEALTLMRLINDLETNRLDWIDHGDTVEIVVPTDAPEDEHEPTP